MSFGGHPFWERALTGKVIGKVMSAPRSPCREKFLTGCQTFFGLADSEKFLTGCQTRSPNLSHWSSTVRGQFVRACATGLFNLWGWGLLLSH